MSMWSAPLQRGEADRRILDGRDQRQLSGELLAERLLVLGGRSPGFLLRLAVIVAGQLLDAATKIAASIGTSAGKNGRKPGLGNACPIASKHSEQSQGQHDRGNDQRPFDEDVIAPVFRERRIGMGHRAISQVVRVFRRHPCRP